MTGLGGNWQKGVIMNDDVLAQAKWDLRALRHGNQISIEAIFGLQPSEIHTTYRMTGLPPKIV